MVINRAVKCDRAENVNLLLIKTKFRIVYTYYDVVSFVLYLDCMAVNIESIARHKNRICQSACKKFCCRKSGLLKIRLIHSRLKRFSFSVTQERMRIEQELIVCTHFENVVCRI